MRITTDAGDMREVRAVLFDMDGTIVDSGQATERTWGKWAQRHGVQDLVILHGSPAIHTVRGAFPDADEAFIEELWLDQLVAEREDVEGIVALPGAHDLIAWLEGEGIPWAVVTSADRLLAEARLGAAGITPRQMITVEDITHGKPHPEPFLAGAALLDVPIAECVVVEDAPPGVEAGMASGAVTAALNDLPGTIRITGLPHLHALLREG